MGARGLVVAWILSVLPLVLGCLGAGSLRIEGASLLGLTLLPWVALAGIPRASREGGAGWLGVIALAVPPLALGAGLDLAGGGDRTGILLAGGGGIAILALLAAGADLARREPRARRVHAGLWFLLVPATAALLAALGWAAAPGEGSVPGLLAGVGRLDPLVWVHRWTRPEGLGEAVDIAVLLGTLLLLAPGLVARGRIAEEPR